jgi:ER lumen protein retaining receptor
MCVLIQILWTFSIYLEAVAIVPQLILLQRHGEVENLTSNYVVLLGAYRGFYVLNWIYRAATEKSYHFIWLMFIAGMVQTALYVDFFYYYAIRCVRHANILPICVCVLGSHLSLW